MRRLFWLYMGMLLLTCRPNDARGLAYMNLMVEGGLNLINFPFRTGANTIVEILEHPPSGAMVITQEGGNFSTNTFNNEAWSNPAQVLPPGKAFFYFNPLPGQGVLTFVGEVPFGRMTNAIPAGFSLQGGQSALRGKITQEMGLQLAPFSNLYLWREGKYELYTYLPNAKWIPKEPEISLGQGFAVRTGASTNWIKDLPE